MNLIHFSDQYYATANMYYASGNRAWKLGGEVNWMWNNGLGWQAYGDFNLRTWYQSDLVTITDQTMTKHYFIAGQRIASKLTESLQPEVVQALKDKPVTPLSGDIRDLPEATANRIARDFDCVGLEYSAFYPGETWIESLENLLNAPEQPAEYQVFFYHSDHLGSSSFNTDVNGDATQHLQYLPFGEDFVHQQNTAAYYTPYTFSGKERDVETSLSYFGARYYESSLSVWLSVDPKTDKFPYQSAFAYCSNNPVMRIDPNGEEDFEVDKNGKIKRVAGTANNQGPDRLVFGKANYDKKTGELKNKSKDVIEVKSDILQKITEGVGSSNGGYEFTSMETESDFNEMRDVFTFLADKTDVEWSLLSESKTPGSCEINKMTVSTSHEAGTERHGFYLADGNKRVVEYGHSHPRRAWEKNGQMYFSTNHPGEGDPALKRQILNYSPQAELWIYRIEKRTF